MTWRYFGGACLVVGAALLKMGAPPVTVVLGISLTALVTFAQNRRRGATGAATSRTSL